MDMQELIGKQMADTNGLVKQISSKKKDSVLDQWVDYKSWFRLWKHVMKVSMNSKPEVKEAQMNFSWPVESMKGVHMVKELAKGRKGQALKMTYLLFDTTFPGAGAANENLFCDPEHTVLFSDMVPNQLLVAMHLKTFMLENVANTLVEMDQNAVHKYFDNIYSQGLPQDTCTYSSQGPAIILSDEQPGERCPCMVVSNRACEATSASWAAVQKKYNDIPTYRLDVPEQFSENPKVIDDFVEDMKNMIRFVSEHTGAEMDWDALRHICDNMNEIQRCEMELYEMNRGPEPPICNDLCWYPNMVFCYLAPTSDAGVTYYKKQLELAQIAHEKGECSVPNLKYRAILWNPPAFVYATFWNWLERCWGIGVCMDMETFRRPVIIDTRTPDSMLRGIAETWCYAPMARHNRGTSANWLGDLEECRRLYRPDMVLNMNHMSCRASVGLTGAMKEWSQEKNCPVCFADYDMYDNRVTSRQEIRDQINRFMQDVMHAEPLDPSLLVFDDSNDW